MVEVKVISDRKEVLEFELVGEAHPFSKLLMHELLQDKDVDVAAYEIKHPLVSNPLFYVKMRKGDPKKAVLSALKSLKKDIHSLSK